MASPSKEGLRCDADRDVNISRLIAPRRVSEILNNPAPSGVNRVEECGGLVLERDPGQGLGTRCYKKDCKKFHPLEVLLSQAVEQNLLGPEQRKKILKAFCEEKFGSQGGQEVAEKQSFEKDVIVSVARELLRMVKLKYSEVPDLVQLLVQNADAPQSSTYCDMCAGDFNSEKRRLIPIFCGKTREYANASGERILSTTILACNSCGFLYEKSSGPYHTRHTRPVH